MLNNKKTLAEFRDQSDKQLIEKLNELKKNIMAQNIASATDRENYKSHLKAVYRRSIAQIMTVLNERKRGV